MSSSHNSVASLIQSGPLAVTEWYQKLKNGNVDAYQAWNPLTVVEAASHRARSELSVEWLAVTVDILEDLALSQPQREREASLLSAMTLRGYFIVRLGPSQSGRLLDLDELVDWFLQGVDLPIETVREKAMHWQQLEAQEILRLRDIKNRLAIFAELDKHQRLNNHPEMRHWLALRNLLP